MTIHVEETKLCADTCRTQSITSPKRILSKVKSKIVFIPTPLGAKAHHITDRILVDLIISEVGIAIYNVSGHQQCNADDLCLDMISLG